MFIWSLPVALSSAPRAISHHSQPFLPLQNVSHSSFSIPLLLSRACPWPVTPEYQASHMQLSLSPHPAAGLFSCVCLLEHPQSGHLTLKPAESFSCQWRQPQALIQACRTLQRQCHPSLLSCLPCSAKRLASQPILTAQLGFSLLPLVPSLFLECALNISALKRSSSSSRRRQMPPQDCPFPSLPSYGF